MGQMPSLVFFGPMSFVVVGLLIGLWAWVLLPGLLRERRNASPVDTVHRSERSSMDTLSQTGMDQTTAGGGARQILVLGDPERIVSARARTRAELRRRAVLARGGFVVAVAAVAGVALGGWWWAPAGVVGAAYLAYVGLVVRLERRLAERREMLHDIDEERERRQSPTVPVPHTDAIEVAVGDERGIVVTGWHPPGEGD